MIPTDKITRKTPISFLRVPDNCLSVGTVRRRVVYSLDAPESYPCHCLAQLPQRANTSVYTTEHCRKAPSPHLQWPLYYRPLSKAMPRFLLNGKMSRMLLCYFCGGHCPRRLPVPRGPRTPQKVYIPERLVVLPFVCAFSLLTFSHIDPNNTMPVQFTKLFSSNTSHTSRSVDAAQPTRRRSTTISMLEEEFGICEPPKATTRFGAAAPFLLSLVFRVLFVVCRFTTQAQNPPSETQEVHHPGSGATSKPILFERAL